MKIYVKAILSVIAIASLISAAAIPEAALAAASEPNYRCLNVSAELNIIKKFRRKW